MRQLTIALVVTALCAATACEKTGEGEYQVEKPVVGTTTDTVHTPTVDVGKDTVTATVPDVDVNMPDTTT